jgi:CheY-like chemotaxis protein
MMPVLDGPATLARLRADPRTAAIPVIFMTARAQARETDRFRSLGAVGVIPKPFDTMTLAASVRSYVQPPARDPLEELRVAFLSRVQNDAARLEQDRLAFQAGERPQDMLERIKRTAHSLAGAGGIYGFADLSDAAAALEDAVIAELEEAGPAAETDRTLQNLLNHAKCRRNGPAPGERMLEVG